MSRWLGKASKAFTRREEPVIEPFEIVCSLGHTVRGLRAADYQEARCSRCGEWLFVLPIDVYPKPKLKRSKKSARTRGTQRVEPVPEPPPIPAAPQPQPAEPREPPAAEADDDLTEKGIHKRRLRWRRSAGLTRFRLVLLAIATILAATGYFVYQGHVVEQAEVSLQDALDRGEKAFSNYNFPAAAADLGVACAALEALGRDDPEARRIQQAFREATAASGLAIETLFDIISEAHTTVEVNAEAWEQRFRTRYRGNWIVVETTLWRGGAGTDGLLHIDYPLVAGDKPVVVSADLPILSRLSVGETPRNIVFAAQLESCRLVSGKGPHWSVVLNPQTAFLWCNYDSYAALGFTADEMRTEPDIRRLLQEQAELMGLTP